MKATNTNPSSIMKISPTLRFLPLLASIALAVPTLAPAAEDTPAPTASSSTPKTADPKPEPFTFEIRNGFIIENGKQASAATIGNVLDYLKKQGKAFNISLGPGVADLQISDLVLNLPEFSGNAIFEAMAASVEAQVKATTPSDPDYGIYRLTLHEDSGRQSQVFNLTDYLNPDGKADDKTIHEKLASLTDIIYKTLKDLDPAFSDAVQPHYQFHEGANLLVVIGTPEDLTVANQVVNALTEQPSQEPQPVAASPMAPDDKDDQYKLARAIAAGKAPAGFENVDKNTAKQFADTLVYYRAALSQLSAEKYITTSKIQGIQQHVDGLQKLLAENSEKFGEELKKSQSKNPPTTPAP
jgi:hypothetical protein